MEHHAFDTKQRYKEKPLCQLPRCDYLSTCHFFTHPISFKAYCRHHINNLIQYALGNNKYSLRQLPRSDCLSSSYFFTHPILFKVYCRHRINNLYNTRWGTINTCYLNYRVTVAWVVVTFLLILSRSKYIVGIASVTYIIRVGGTISVCNTNYRVAVGLLVGQGWEWKRPTLPRLRREKTRP